MKSRNLDVSLGMAVDFFTTNLADVANLFLIGIVRGSD